MPVCCQEVIVGPLTRGEGIPNVACQFQEMAMSSVILFFFNFHVDLKKSVM